MDIYESDLPGVGQKHEVDLGGGKRLVVVTHNTGKREIYRKANADADGEKLFELSDRQARTVGTILEGAYFQPVQSSRVETVLSDDTLLEWYNVGEGSELAGQSIDGSNVRERTGVSIVAIQRGEEVMAPPTPDITIEVDDTIVVVGDREGCSAFETMLNVDGS